MTDKEKDQLVEKVMRGFDFKRVHALNILSDHKLTDKTIDDLKSRARKLLLMALDHQDREFWWAGGMHHGGICACYDNKWGLSLNYIFEANRERVPRHKSQTESPQGEDAGKA